MPSPRPSDPPASPQGATLHTALLLAARDVQAVLAGQSLATLHSNSHQAHGVTPADLRAGRALAQHALRWLGSSQAWLERHHDQPIRPRWVRPLLITALATLWPQPRYAIPTLVNQTTQAVKKRSGSASLASWCNALMRRACAPREAGHADALQTMQGRWNHPDWWVKRMQADHPQHWQAQLTLAQSHPPMGLRVHLGRVSMSDYLRMLTEAGIACADHRDRAPGALRLLRPVPVSTLPGFEQGLVSVQDVHAQHVTQWLLPRRGERVLDACAAPGGKSCLLAEQYELDLLALDLDAQRIGRFEENRARLGLRFDIRQGDAGDPPSWWDGRLFDRILLGAPCSASGVSRRHPDARWLRRESDIDTMAREQQRLLQALWPLLKPGGRLLYVTCSLFAQEGPQTVSTFLQQQGVAAPDTLPYGWVRPQALPALACQPLADQPHSPLSPSYDAASSALDRVAACHWQWCLADEAGDGFFLACLDKSV